MEILFNNNIYCNSFSETVWIPSLFYRKEEFKKENNVKSKSKKKAKEKSDFNHKLYCIICKNYITESNQQINIYSTSTHTFVNPNGYIYNVRCFKSAPGCNVVGNPSKEFTWFPEYFWQIAVCSKCFNHIGWKYSSEKNIFYGLINDRIEILR